jgi:predicted DNA-binding ribbon-helix-helix protein
MRDIDKTKEQLIDELDLLRKKVKNLTPFRRILVFVVFKAFTTIGAY